MTWFRFPHSLYKKKTVLQYQQMFINDHQTSVNFYAKSVECSLSIADWDKRQRRKTTNAFSQHLVVLILYSIGVISVCRFALRSCGTKAFWLSELLSVACPRFLTTLPSFFLMSVLQCRLKLSLNVNDFNFRVSQISGFSDFMGLKPDLLKTVFYKWITTIDYCLTRGFKHYDSGPIDVIRMDQVKQRM